MKDRVEEARDTLARERKNTRDAGAAVTPQPAGLVPTAGSTSTPGDAPAAIDSQTPVTGAATAYVRDDSELGLALVGTPDDAASREHASLEFTEDPGPTRPGLQVKLDPYGGIRGAADGLSVMSAAGQGTQNAIPTFDANGQLQDPTATMLALQDIQLASGKHLTAAAAGTSNLFAVATPGGTGYLQFLNQKYQGSTGAGGTLYGIYGENEVQITDNVAHYLLGAGVYAQKTVAATKTDTGYLLGLTFQALRNIITGADDDGTLSNIYGILAQYGHYNTVGAATPQTTNAYGLYVTPYKATGTITNAYDVYLAAEIAGGTVTSGYGIYQANSKANRFGGYVDAIGGFKDNGVAGVDGTTLNGDTVGGGILTALGTTKLVAPGSMVWWGGSSPPTGWLDCDGSAVSQATYADLYSAIGVTYGNPGGGNFNLPNAASKFVRGNTPGTGAGADTHGHTVTGTIPGDTANISDHGAQSTTGNTGHRHTVASGAMNDITAGATGETNTESTHEHSTPLMSHSQSNHDHGGSITSGAAASQSNIPAYIGAMLIIKT